MYIKYIKIAMEQKIKKKFLYFPLPKRIRSEFESNGTRIGVLQLADRTFYVSSIGGIFEEL